MSTEVILTPHSRRSTRQAETSIAICDALSLGAVQIEFRTPPLLLFLPSRMAHFMHYVLDALTRYSSRPLFKQFTGTPESPAWKTVTYGTFLDDVERSASYWVRHLGVEVGLKPCDVVGVWYACWHLKQILFRSI